MAKKVVCDCERKTAAAPKFLAEFFFPKTSNRLRKLSARRSRDVKGWSMASAPFAPSEIVPLVDEQAAPQAQEWSMV
jgi:hypothetical protein